MYVMHSWFFIEKQSIMKYNVRLDRYQFLKMGFSTHSITPNLTVQFIPSLGYLLESLYVTCFCFHHQPWINNYLLFLVFFWNLPVYYFVINTIFDDKNPTHFSSLVDRIVLVVTLNLFLKISDRNVILIQENKRVCLFQYSEYWLWSEVEKSRPQ